MKQGSTNLVICSHPPITCSRKSLPRCRREACTRSGVKEWCTNGLWLMAHGLRLLGRCGCRSVHSRSHRPWLARQTRSPQRISCAKQRHRIKLDLGHATATCFSSDPPRSIGAQDYGPGVPSGSQGFASYSSAFTMTNVPIL